MGSDNGLVPSGSELSFSKVETNLHHKDALGSKARLYQAIDTVNVIGHQIEMNNTASHFLKYQVVNYISGDELEQLERLRSEDTPRRPV